MWRLGRTCPAALTRGMGGPFLGSSRSVARTKRARMSSGSPLRACISQQCLSHDSVTVNDINSEIGIAISKQWHSSYSRKCEQQFQQYDQWSLVRNCRPSESQNSTKGSQACIQPTLCVHPCSCMPDNFITAARIGTCLLTKRAFRGRHRHHLYCYCHLQVNCQVPCGFRDWKRGISTNEAIWSSVQRLRAIVARYGHLVTRGTVYTRRIRWP